MSGDVQPRKRKDKKKKKDELGLEEPRGTAAALGEGDVFMHSYSDHGTGGHWCAKIIFFSLLAVLVTLIGLIILENRGLSELEANAVESRYSNILEGWLEDAPDDDHHDEHTLELKHHDDDEEDDHYNSQDVGDHDEEHEDEEHTDEDEDDHVDEDEDELADDDEDENADEDEDENEDEDDDSNADEDDESNADEPEDMQEDDDEQNYDRDIQQDVEDDEDEDDSPYKYYTQDDEDDDEADTRKDDDDEEAEDDEDEQDTAQDQDELNYENESNEELGNEDEDGEDRENEGDEDEEIIENDDDEEDNLTNEDEDEHEHHEEEDDEVEVERIEREALVEEPIVGLPVLQEEDDDDDDKDDDQDESEDDDEARAGDDEEEADDDFLEVDEPPPVVEHVTAPAGKPFVEVDEDDISTETPPDTLEEEEEYEKQQEELRKEEEQSTHHIWLKLTVGAALLVATHAVLRRATAPRDEPEQERPEREETPIVDRRMTLIPEQAAPTVGTKSEKPIVEGIVRREAPVIKAHPVVKQESEEEEVDEPEIEEVVEEEEIEEDEPEKLEAPKKKADKELYSEEEEEEENIIVPKKEAPKAVPLKPEPEPEEDPDDDVEIIDDEQLEEELEDEEDDVSDVDDTELLSRLEAKYGRLPEPERPGQKHKDGGNSIEDVWPGEPADVYWRQQLDSAERELRQGAWSAALSRGGAGALAGSARARFVAAAALDRLAEARRDNALLSRAIAAYFHLLEMSERLPDNKLVEVARRTLDRIQFRGNYLKAEPIYRLLIRRFPNEPAYRNNLTISFLMANRNDLAENVLKETLARWPDDRIALAHYGFILKTTHKDRLEEAVDLFQRALDGDKGPACEPRFYYHYGDALLLLGRFEEAHEVHKRGAKLGHFLSPAQRSLYNVPRLKSQPWWDVNDTPYTALARNLERRWKEILKEGQRAAGLYKEEEEGLRERGQWGQMDLFVRGQEVAGRCGRAPVTCAVVRAEPAAAGCGRGQVKFSQMAPGTHVRPHVGPTNCRLRMHLGLSNTKNTYLRVDQETRQWQEGKVLLFDDSFEHEVWHNGSGARLVLIVDVWHPALTARERRALPPI